jgi:hypothetical protein
MPAGYRRAVASGLIVPDEISRVRMVLSWQQWRTLEKATQDLQQAGVSIYLRCNESGCQSQPIERVRTPEGGISLRCCHADRVYTKAVK